MTTQLSSSSRIVVRLASTVLCALSACGTSPFSDAPTHRLVERFRFPSVTTETWLFLVDDRHTAPSSELRERFLAEFRGVESDPHEPCEHNPVDPEAWNPINRRAIIAHPSADAPHLVGPGQNAALEISATVVTSASLERWVNATADAVEAPLGTVSGANAVLERVADTVSLLARDRAPTSAEEASLVDGVDAPERLLLSVVTASEDESPSTPPSYALPRLAGAGQGPALELIDLVLPTDDPQSCETVRQPTPRFASWMSSTGLLDFPAHTWRPGDTCNTRANKLQTSCDSRCWSQRPRMDRDGRPSCSLFVETELGKACPEQIGWFTPAAGNPRVPSATSPDVRTCEVRHLSGDDELACRTQSTCPSCQAGYCFSNLFPAPGCENTEDTRPRFIGGADRGQNGTFTLICDAL